MAHQRKTAVIFPGQGSQYLGMGRDVLHRFQPAGNLLKTACAGTGEDLERLCLKGPLRKLSRTDNLQPAITVINLSCYMYWRRLGGSAHAAAGHSLGEISALAAAGCIDVETALELAIVRGNLMHEAAGQQAGAMAAVIGLKPAVIRKILVKHDPSEQSVVIANMNTPEQTVLSGSVSAMKNIRGEVIRRGGRWVALQVSGAWHSPLMESVVSRWHAVVRSTRMSTPEIPVYLNVTGSPARDIDTIRSALVQQLTRPVLWTKTIRSMLNDGISRFLVLGPGKNLRHIILKNLPSLENTELLFADDLAAIDRLFE